MRRLFVLVPALLPTGPIKGAVALGNSLVEYTDVTLVSLKPHRAYADAIDPRIRIIDLGSLPNWRSRVREYRRMLKEAGGRTGVTSISFCFSADMVNYLMRDHAVAISSLRGHLLKTYRVDYGLSGWLLALFHFWVVGRLDRVIAMTELMARQCAPMLRRPAAVIGNFVDEAGLEPFRSNDAAMDDELRFVFVGRMDPLKSPLLVIRAVCDLAHRGVRCSLDLYGDGPLLAGLKARVSGQGHGGFIRFHGHVTNPWSVAATAHCMVLPSLTEGISRAAMESLYLGVPCVMRDVDSNAELIEPGRNGALFKEDASLVDAMRIGAEIGKSVARDRPVLLKSAFREKHCADAYVKLLSNL